MSEFLSTNIPKFTSVFTAIGAFFVVLAVLFAIAGRANGKKARPIALVILLGPALVLLLAGQIQMNLLVWVITNGCLKIQTSK
jgi:alpha-glucoside transport system permease protein